MDKEQKIFITYEDDANTEIDEYGEYEYLQTFDPHCFEDNKSLMKYTMESLISVDGQFKRSLDEIMESVLDVYSYGEIDLIDDIDYEDELIIISVIEKFCKVKRSQIKQEMKEFEAEEC